MFLMDLSDGSCRVVSAQKVILIKPACGAVLEHDPEKCAAVFRKDHAQSKT
jgi:hypothetical protein